MNRKNFLTTASLLATSSMPLVTFGKNLSKFSTIYEKDEIDFIYDGIKLNPSDYSSLLAKLVDKGDIKPDYYSNGGVVEELENKFAEMLGKESAVFMPTGTLANHIAIRKLAGESRRIIVQEQSHIYNDSGDCAQTLSNLNLLPLGTNKVGFTLEEIQKAHEKTKKGRVETRIGVIAIESPVRRMKDCAVEINAMAKISEYAKSNGIKMHMDGARLFVQSVHEGIEPKKYANYFDTVYTSMYKCFNASSGAILAGSKEFTKNLFHERRMFGGGLPNVWPFAAIALYYADKFIKDYGMAINNAERMFKILQIQERFEVTRFTNGTHIFGLKVNVNNKAAYTESLKQEKILVRENDDFGYLLKINPTINRKTPEEIANIFINSLKKAE